MRANQPGYSCSICFAFAANGLMMMLFIVPYCLAGIGGPAMQSIISNQVPENAQGEIQGITTSLQSLAAIIGPFLASHIFVYFIQDGTPLYFPGAPFILSAFLTLIGLLIAIPLLVCFKILASHLNLIGCWINILDSEASKK